MFVFGCEHFLTGRFVYVYEPYNVTVRRAFVRKSDFPFMAE